MSKTKKQIRGAFRTAVLSRDGYQCACCGVPGKCRQTGYFEGPDVERVELDAHHITDRNEMPNGGYVAENGISLCPDCHVKAEMFHQTEGAFGEDVYLPTYLYEIIGSSYDVAIVASEKL